MMKLSLKSIYNRRLTAALTIIAIAFSVALLLGVERISSGAREGFEKTVSGADLIIGARSGATQLLLYSVFHIGRATNNISWQSYQDFADHPEVKWTIPLSLGDSHHGFRVVGTTEDYFEHYKYGSGRALSFSAGRPFEDLFDVVLGSDVAKRLNYDLGRKIVLSHGIEKIALTNHEDKPFKVAGILKKTGTPVDRALYISLGGIEAIHADWQGGIPAGPESALSVEEVKAMRLEPKAITAFMVGLKSKIGIFYLQRQVGSYREEPLMAVLPGVALKEMWKSIGVAEKVLLVISAFVVITGLIGMLTVILTNLNVRRREMAVLRSVGARPHHLFSLLAGEAAMLASIGSLSGLLLLYAFLFIGAPILESSYGIFVPLKAPSSYDLSVIAAVILAGFLLGCFPAWQAYKNSLEDGLVIRL